ncbi:hypothetical protein QP860_09735 [Aerococcus sp. UMB1112A]|uniref:hypothetical protein n=2 Tax=Aerococcus TaxID=1375 RepID=UPI00254B8466|nr:hypothetical protein [Aerococcus sp. UMB1112A]MDK8503304.1 hypothetical protein [Aerococcus sp. UMB1112A]
MNRIETSNFKDLNESEFLNEFYKVVYEFARYLYKRFNSLLTEEKIYSQFFDNNDISCFIILNKLFFQYIYSFFILNSYELSIPSFNSFRTTMEIFRLFRLVVLDEDFRKDYLQNKNIEFRTVRDNRFMQSKIIKKLDELETDLRNSDTIPLSINLQNHNYTKNSTYSEIHSELSKWSHALNVNLIFPMFINDNKINLKITDENSIYKELHVKKYVEGMCLMLLDHSSNLGCIGPILDDDLYAKTTELLEMYDKYVEIFYKN